MKLIIAKDYEAVSELAAGLVLGEMMEDRRVNLSLTAGNSPAGMYRVLLERLAKVKMDKTQIHYYNFDEIPFKDEKEGLTMSSLRAAFYKPAGIDEKNIHELNVANYEGYDEKLKSDGGLDLVVMGIGMDGHFCGNIPGYTGFDKQTYLTDIEPNGEMYNQLKELMGKEPGDSAVTFGPRTVMAARKLVLLVTGEKKAEIIAKALNGKVTEDVPASILRLHPNLTVIMDEAAAKCM